MNVSEKTTEQGLVLEALKNSISYTKYREVVAHLVEENSTTGHEKTEALANYTMLNNKRMKRWDKTVKINDEAKTAVEHFNKKVTWLVLTESWCGDAAHIMPVINKVAERNENIDYKVVLRDENEALMNHFLTHGNKAIPKLIMIDNETQEVLNTFGPRPNTAAELVIAYKTEHGQLTPEFKEDLQHWYNKDKGQSTVEDLLKLLS